MLAHINIKKKKKKTIAIVVTIPIEQTKKTL